MSDPGQSCEVLESYVGDLQYSAERAIELAAGDWSPLHEIEQANDIVERAVEGAQSILKLAGGDASMCRVGASEGGPSIKADLLFYAIGALDGLLGSPWITDPESVYAEPMYDKAHLVKTREELLEALRRRLPEIREEIRTELIEKLIGPENPYLLEWDGTMQYGLGLEHSIEEISWILRVIGGDKASGSAARLAGAAALVRKMGFVSQGKILKFLNDSLKCLQPEAN